MIIHKLFYTPRIVTKISTLMDQLTDLQNVGKQIKAATTSNLTTQNIEQKNYCPNPQMENGHKMIHDMKRNDALEEEMMPSSSGLNSISSKPGPAIGGMTDTDGDQMLLGELRSRQWKKPTESFFFLQQLARQGLQPRQILKVMYPRCVGISQDIPDAWIMQLLRELCEQRTRQKLAQYNTFDDAIDLFRRSNRIVVITGAGVSVSCGIPDFRSENGIYARLKKDFPELPTPSAMFDIDFFQANPKPFFNFAREIFPGQFRPSLSHMFIKFLEEEGKLLRNYTQNIDTLERTAGITNLIECHGSFATATCLSCKHKVDAQQIREDVFAQRVAHCPICLEGVMKPDIVFFGEELGDSFHDQMGSDHDQLDLLVVIGSSMQVQPVSLIPYNIAPQVPQILINRELLSGYQADVILLGSCDPILVQIALALGGKMRENMLNELRSRQDNIQSGKTQFSNDLMALIQQNEQNCTNGIERQFRPKSFTAEEFKRMIDEGKKVEGRDEMKEGRRDEEEGPERKRIKMREEEVKRDTLEDEEESERRVKMMRTDVKAGEEEDEKPEVAPSTFAAGLWQGNYVVVEAHLPSADSILLVPPNVNVFIGAELFYDRDQDTFVRRIGKKERRGTDHCHGEGDHSSSGSETTETFSTSTSTTDEPRGGSLPPADGRTLNIDEKSTKMAKARSCSPSIMGGQPEE